MSERIAQHKQNLIAARTHLDIVLDSVGDQWDTQVYSDGAAWTVRQLAIHLVESERGQSRVVMGIAQGENPVPPDFDVNRYNRRSVEKRAEMSIAEVRETLNVLRAAFMQWLDSIDESVLEKEGRHPSLKVLTVDQFLSVMAAHERQHADDIASILNRA